MTATHFSLAVDVSNTLDSMRLSGVQRVALRTAEELSTRPNVDLTLLDGRTGVLRPLRSFQHERLFSHFDREPSAAIERVSRRAARLVPTAPAWKPSGWLVDLEPSWHAPQPRTTLLPTLPPVRTAALVHDLLPLREPDWFPPQSVQRFERWLQAHRTAQSTLVANSEATASDLTDFYSLDVTPPVLRLGVDPVDTQPPPDNGLILMVGTIEPRKGHALVLDALDRMDTPPTIDVVGSAGWADNQLLQRLDGHRHVRWHRDLTDASVEHLLELTSLLLQPSLNEGFGLPVAEALSRGIPVLATDLPVLDETAKGSADLLAPTAQAWAQGIARFVTDAPYREKLRKKAAGFEPWTWGKTGNDLLAALSGSPPPD